uniref:Cyclin-like domain-containing protein n=1 Tax=Kalanchoe fedtschenkoi TaxID=63787 RepID=A0A7N0U7K4_KALFE
MPKKRPVAALHFERKKLRSKLPPRRPRTRFSPLLSLLNDDLFVRRRRRSSSSASPLLYCHERLLSVDDSSRLMVVEWPTRRRRVTRSSARTCSSHAAAVDVAQLVSESSSCVESCSVVGESDAIANWIKVGSSNLDRAAASEFDVTSQEQYQPSFAFPHQQLASSGKFNALMAAEDDDVSIVVEGGMDSPPPVNFIDIQDRSSSEPQDADFSPSMYLDSGSEFSERSVGDSSPSPTYSFLLEYRRAFQRSAPPVNEHVPHRGEIAWLRFEDKTDEECYLNLRVRERRQAYIIDHTRQSRSLIKKRLEIVHWIVQQSATMELQKETMFLGVNLLDRFLSNGSFKYKRNLQVVGIACLTLATRIEENQIYNSVRQSTFRMGRNTYSRSQVVAMEWLVQEVLNFKCFLPTVYNFLSFYLKAARADIEMAKTAQNLAELALLEPEQLLYWPSTVAASLVILSCIPSNQYLPHICVMKAHLRSADDNINECVKVSVL